MSQSMLTKFKGMQILGATMPCFGVKMKKQQQLFCTPVPVQLFSLDL